MTGKPTRIVFAGGGTGGHLFPALAIAQRITELVKGTMPVEIAFVGTKRGLEYRLRESLGFPLHLITIRGWSRSFTLKNFLVPFLVIGALLQSYLFLKRFSPDLVVGTGGYVSWPLLKVAAFRNIPTVLQEQNSFPGVTTRQLAKNARRIYLGFEAARQYLQTNGEIMVTGNPVRPALTRGKREEALKAFQLDTDKTTILVLGGSQGAHAINAAVLRSLEKSPLPEGYQLLWQTGKKDYTDVAARAGRKVTHCAFFPFAEQMESVYAAADIAIARAGALSVAELLACGIPPILIPYPYAAGDHQRKNAEEIARRHMAIVIENDRLPELDLLVEAVAFHQSARFREIKRTITEWNEQHQPAVDIIAEDILALVRHQRKAGA